MSIGEELGRKAIMFFPHTPFGQSSVYAFSHESMDYNYYVTMQVFDIGLCLMFVYFLDNFTRIKKSILSGQLK